MKTNLTIVFMVDEIVWALQVLNLIYSFIFNFSFIFNYSLTVR